MKELRQTSSLLPYISAHARPAGIASIPCKFCLTIYFLLFKSVGDNKDYETNKYWQDVSSAVVNKPLN